MVTPTQWSMRQDATPSTWLELLLPLRASPFMGTTSISMSHCTWIPSLTPGTRTDWLVQSPSPALGPLLPSQFRKQSTRRHRATQPPPLDTWYPLATSPTHLIHHIPCIQGIQDTLCTQASPAAPSCLTRKARRPLLTIRNTGSTVYPRSPHCITLSTCRTAARASSTGRMDAFALLWLKTRSTCPRLLWKLAMCCHPLHTDRGTLWCSDPPVAQWRDD